jgi:hypothetical protein
MRGCSRPVEERAFRLGRSSYSVIVWDAGSNACSSTTSFRDLARPPRQTAQFASSFTDRRAQRIADGYRSPAVLQLCASFHLFPQRKRTHVGPYLFDVREAFRFLASFAHRSPSSRDFLGHRPNGVLLFVIHHEVVMKVTHEVQALPKSTNHAKCRILRNCAQTATNIRAWPVNRDAFASRRESALL